MIEITVKTLDSRNHPFTVEDDITVKDFKDLIAEKVDIPAETQRLIYCGRVLQDAKKLNEYDVNGKVVHLVQRAPPQPNRPASDSPNFQQRFHTRHQVPNQIFLGSMAYSADLDGQGIPQLPLSSNLSRHRLNVANKMLVLASAIIDQLENPETDTTSVVERILDDPIDTTPLLAAQVYVPAFSNVYVDQQAALNAALSMTNNILNSENNNPQAEPAVPPEPNVTAPNYDDEAAAPAATPAEGTPAEPQTTEAQQGEPSSTDSNTTRTGSPIQTRSLAVLIEKLNRIQTRLQPFMNTYYELMNTDPTFASDAEMETAQRTCDRVSAVMHALGHGYHALSDVLCQFNRPAPRMLLCRPTLVPQAVVQAGISVPVQVQAHLDVENMTPRMDLGDLFRQRNEGEEQVESEAPVTTQANRTPPVTVTQRPGGGRNVDIIVAMNPDDDSLSQALGPNQELIQSLLAAVTNSVMRTVSLQGGVPVSISSGAISIPVGENFTPSTDAAPSAPTETTPATNTATNGVNAAGQNSQARGNTATLPTTSTQTPRATPRPHVHLSPHSFRAFDPFLQCNSHHISGRNRGNRPAPSAPQETPTETTPDNSIGRLVRQARVFSYRNLQNQSAPSSSNATNANSRSQTPTRREQSSERPATAAPAEAAAAPPRAEDVIRALLQGAIPPNVPAPTTASAEALAPGDLFQTLLQAAIGRAPRAQPRPTPRTVVDPSEITLSATEIVQNGAPEERTVSNKRNTSEATTTSMDVDTFYDAPEHVEDSESGPAQKVLLPSANGEGSTPPVLPEVNIGSEFWHNNVPSEWVSVVTRDVQVQRHDSTTTAQPPYSDAYLTSVPAKRRKVISCNKPQGSLPQVITESLRQAVLTTGLSGVAPIESVTAAAGGDSTIQAAYREELRQSIRARPPHATPPGGIAPIKRFPNASFCFRKP